MKFYWYTTCYNCHHQGRLIVMMNLTSGKPYLHCEECESGWYDPLKINDMNARFLTLTEDFDAREAAWNEIEAAGWQPYAENSADK